MGELAFLLVVLLLLLPGPVFTIMNIWNLVRRKEKTGRFEVVAFSVGIFYTLILYYGVLSPRPWDEAVWLYADTFLFHEIIASEHTPGVVVCIAIGFLCYILLKRNKGDRPPLAQVLCISGLYLGILIQALLLVQLMRHMPFVEIFTGVTGREDDGMYICYLSLVPFNFLLCAIRLLFQVLKGQREEQQERTYEKAWLRRCNQLFCDSRKWGLYALFLLLPLLLLLMLILVLFGQQPDSMIRAFTETADWTLSAKIAPPPVELDAHYLCTVALQGDERLVKPLRYGIRRGQRIVVNRQLCVANAFEQLLEERMPAFHRRVRHFYDTYGYPLSLHLQTPWRANLAYLLMKPLEWCFLGILYLFDKRPEDRIARQYL